jgi:hypothetical protein
MNLLISLLAATRPGVLPRTGEERYLDRVVSDLTVRPERAEPGTLCLLAYDTRTWHSFTRQAQRLDRPPTTGREVALAGLERDNYFLVVPEPPVPEPVLALWRIAENGTLQVSIAEPAPADTETAQVIEALERGPESFDQPAVTFPCENRKSDLRCVDRACSSGTCGQYSFVDPKSGRELYACACRDQ